MKIYYVINKDKETMDGCVYYRNFLPALYLTGNKKHSCKLSNKFFSKSQENKETKSIDVFWDISFILESDVIVFSRFYQVTDFPMIKAFVEAAKHYKKKIVYETDDDFFNIPVDNPVYEEAIQSRELVLFLMRNADAITVSTKKLAEHLRGIVEKPFYVLENSVDFNRPGSFYKSQFPEKAKDVIRIGWTGGQTHGRDVKVAVRALQKIAKKYPNSVEIVTLCGPKMDEIFNMKHTNVKSVPVEIYHDVLEDLDLDIGLCPLEDTTFNRNKSAIKWQEYSMNRTAVIASNVSPYSDYIENGVTGVLVENTIKSWVGAMEDLIEDKILRTKMGDNAFDKVYDDLNISQNFQNWGVAYERIYADKSK